MTDAPLYPRLMGDRYPRLMGDRWESLPPAIRTMHENTVIAEGTAEIQRGGSLLAWIIAHLMKLPPTGRETPVKVHFIASGAGEIWTRTFGRRSFSSRQYEGGGRSKGLLCERFGCAEFAMALVLEGGRLRLVLRRWRLFGVPMSMWLAPHSDAYDGEEAGVFHFHVDRPPSADRVDRALPRLVEAYRRPLAPVT